jgi:hypothetical protein
VSNARSPFNNDVVFKITVKLNCNLSCTIKFGSNNNFKRYNIIGMTQERLL